MTEVRGHGAEAGQAQGQWEAKVEEPQEQEREAGAGGTRGPLFPGQGGTGGVTEVLGP